MGCHMMRQKYITNNCIIIDNMKINNFEIIDSLQEIYSRYKAPLHHGDKGTTHTYIDKYQELLEPHRKNSTVLEIGIYEGLSLLMWQEYFINSNIVGIDITDMHLKRRFSEVPFDYIIGDATKYSILDNFTNTKFDVIIDDGSHYWIDQIKSFNIFKTKMNKNGIYIIEDVNNIDDSVEEFRKLHDNIEIFDNRHINDRFDDVLIIYRF